MIYNGRKVLYVCSNFSESLYLEQRGIKPRLYVHILLQLVLVPFIEFKLSHTCCPAMQMVIECSSQCQLKEHGRSRLSLRSSEGKSFALFLFDQWVCSPNIKLCFTFPVPQYCFSYIFFSLFPFTLSILNCYSVSQNPGRASSQ